jgi:hypothetical protein
MSDQYYDPFYDVDDGGQGKVAREVAEALDPMIERLSQLETKFAREAVEYKKSQDARAAATAKDPFAGASVDFTGGKDADYLKAAADRANARYKAGGSDEAQRDAYRAQLALEIALERGDYKGKSDEELSTLRNDQLYAIEDLEIAQADLESQGKPAQAKRAEQQEYHARAEIKRIDSELERREEDGRVSEHVRNKAESAVAKHYRDKDRDTLAAAAERGDQALAEAVRLIENSPYEQRSDYDKIARAKLKQATANFETGVVDAYMQLITKGTIERNKPVISAEESKEDAQYMQSEGWKVSGDAALL